MPGAVQGLEKHVGVVLVQLNAGIFDRDAFLRRDRHAFRLLFGLEVGPEDLPFFAVNPGEECGPNKSIWPAPHGFGPHGQLNGFGQFVAHLAPCHDRTLRRFMSYNLYAYNPIGIYLYINIFSIIGLRLAVFGAKVIDSLA